MSQEFIAVLDYMEKERGIKRELLYEAVHAALLAAARKSFGPARDLSVELDQKTGKIKAIASDGSAGHGGEGEGATTAAYYAIDPPLVVNFEDGSAVRFLQITMALMAHDQKAIDSVQKNIPLIRNNLLLLMSNRNYQSMMSREGKDKFREEALAEVRAVLKKQGGPDIDDVLFTSFVVQ